MEEEGLCPLCHSGKLWVVSEKTYDAAIHGNSLELFPESETWLEIKCSECGHLFDPDEFEEIY
jgi:rubredoxin